MAIRIFVILLASCALLVYAEQKTPWPSCTEITNTQSIFNLQDSDHKLFDIPSCSTSFWWVCQYSCCQAQYDGKILRGLMASPFEALKYYVENHPGLTGSLTVPFYFYNEYRQSFDLTLWEPTNVDKFKFQVYYYHNHAIFKYIGNVAAGYDLIFVPYMAPATKALIDQLMTGFDLYLGLWVKVQSALPSGCSCGFYQAISIRSDNNCDSTRYTCYNNYRGEFTCADIDECIEGTDNCDLIPNSHCVNTEGSFRCECDMGYLRSDTQCLDVGEAIRSKVETTSTNARVFVTSADLPKPSWRYSYNITDTTNPTYPMPVYRAMQIKVSQAMAKSGVLVSNLNPGKNYTLTWDVLNENNTVVSEYYGYTSPETQFTTLCTCGRQSDAPVLLGNETITQQNGHIYFKFLGNSMCGDAYTFARQSYNIDGTLSKHTVFTPNYFFSGGECSPIPYEPGKAAADVLANSKLTVGAKYRYTFRAVGSKYLGDSSSMDFAVRWESSINGFVGLQPTFGDLPVEDVMVRWALKDENGTTVLDGSTITSKSGRFTIHPYGLIPFDNDRDYPMHLSFSKVTEIDEAHKIDHEFMCNNGRVNCTDTDLVIHLKHLDFDIPVNVIDTTSVPIYGKVYVADTNVNPDGTRWGGDGCPVEKAKVCLIDRSPSGTHSELTCTETAGDGTYELAGVIGSRVSINVTFNNHTFEYLPSKGYPDFSYGIDIQPHKIYEHNDFMDMTNVPLEITIAGGVCDFFLGAAEVSYNINGCLWGGKILKQPNLRNVYTIIPAHDLRFEVKSIIDRPDIRLPVQNVDLREVPFRKSPEPAVHEESNDTVNITKVRFQHDGVSKIRVQFQGEMNEGCTTMSPDITSIRANSIHVLSFQRPTLAMIFLERDLGGGLVCDGVDSSFQLMIQNNLGLQVHDSGDDAYAAAIASTYPHEMLELLYHCNQGCVANITQDYDLNLGRNTRARVEFQFMTGRPNIATPFVKQLIVQTVEPNSESYIAAVVVTGQYKRGDLYTVGLPTYEPILIIRDPPGGSSYAFYENVQTTLRIESFKHTEYTGPETNVKFQAGEKADIGSCAGLGISLCQGVVKTKNVLGYHYNSAKYDLKNLNYTVRSGGFTTTWSYKTSSSNPLFTGNMSDTYVVPNLNMKFSLIDTVSWNQSTCSALSTEETAFNLESPENVPALAFVTGFEIVNTEIPSLELNIETTKKALRQTEDQAERAQLESELETLEDALQGWRDALSLNDELKHKAIGNDTFQVKPHEWFSKVALKEFGNNTDVIDTSGMSHHSALLSEELMSRSKLRPFYRTAQSSITDLESINTIKFAGGGTELMFRLAYSKMKQHVSDLGDSKTSTVSDGGDLSLDNTYTLVNIIFELSDGSRSESSDENFRTDETSSATNIGFALSDPDAGDQFDVDVFVDPVFGTFIFHTRSGKSLCKHETGTENRQLVKLELVSIPPQIILEDEPVAFHYRITKLGMGSLGYMLVQDVREDSDALHYYPLLPREYAIIEYGQSFLGTLTLTRGPEKYEYPAITLIIQPTCEFGSLPLLGEDATLAKIELYNYIDPVDQSKKIVFARPCAPVVLQGDIAKDRTFVVRSDNPDAPVTVVVQNPESNTMTWANAIQDSQTRLKRVQLYYRPLGASQWQVGQHLVNDKLVNIDFALAGVEDAYGFATMEWAVSHIQDGNYEMQVRTVCDDVHDAPAIFNGQQTEVIQGVFDRKPPKLYGLPQPQGRLPIGQPIVVTFDEPLDCSLPNKFVVNLQVQGIERRFDNDNLLLICEDRRILIQFDGGNTDMNDLVGKSLSMNLTQVVDVNRNLMISKVPYSVNIITADVDQASYTRRQLQESQANVHALGPRDDQVTLRDLEKLKETLKREIFEEMQTVVQENMEALAKDIKESIRNMLVAQ